MARNNVEAILTYHVLTSKGSLCEQSVTIQHFTMYFELILISCIFHLFIAGPLDSNPVGEMDRIINKLRLKYRTYVVGLDVEYVSCLSNGVI
jgi:uncharacterized membrane protein (DUF485 family)